MVNGAEAKILDERGKAAAPAPSQEQDQRTGPKPVVQVAIVMFDNGQVQVNGPLHEQVMMYGLLQTARDIVHEHNRVLREQAASRIAMPKGSPGWWAGMFARRGQNVPARN